MRSKLASSIAILLNYGAKWRALYYIFYVMCVNIELSIVVNGRQLFSPAQGSREDQTAQHKKDLTTITKSLLGVILNALDLGQMELSTVAIFITMVILIVIIPFTLLAMCLGWGKIVRSCGRFILIVLSLNDFFLLLLFTLLQRTLTCRDYKIIYVTETKVDSAEALFVPAYWVENSNGIKEVIDSRPDLSMDITCYQSKHIILLGMLFISLIGSLGLKLVQSRFFQHQLDFNYSMKKSNLDYLHFGSLTGLVCFRLFYFLGTKQDMEPSLYLYVALIIMGLSYLMHLYRDTFIKPSENVVRSTEIGFLLFAVIVVLVERAFLDQVLHLGKTTFFIAEILIVVMVFRLTAIARKTGVSLKSYNENNEKLKSDFEDLVIACFHYLQRILDSKQPEQLKSELADSIFTVFANSKRQLGSKHPVIQCIGWMLAHFKRSGSFRGSADYGLSELEETILDQKQNISNEATQAYPQYARVIDTVDESTQREIKEVVKLLGLLLAEYFKLKSNLMLTAPQYMLSSLVYYHLIYAVKPAIAVNLIKQAAKSGRPEDLHTKIMEQTVHLLLERAWTTGNLFMPEQRSRLRFKCDQENKVNFRQTIDYLDSLRKLKSGIGSMLDQKHGLLNDADKSDFDMVLFYQRTWVFSKLRRECASLLNSYSTTPFKLVVAFYYFHVEYDGRKAFQILKSVKKRPFRFFGFEGELGGEHDDLVISVSLEHLILTVTSNSSDHVGYTSVELLNSNLDLLLPLPVRSNHSRLMLLGQGVLLETKIAQQLFISTKFEHIRPIELCIRAAFNIKNGYTVVARLQFVEERFESGCMMILDPQLEILETSMNASLQLERGVSLKQYSAKWVEILQEYLTVAGFKLKYQDVDLANQVELNDRNNRNLLGQGEVLSKELVQKYNDLQRASQISVVNRQGESVVFLFKVNALYIRPLNGLYCIINFTVHSDPREASLILGMTKSRQLTEDGEDEVKLVNTSSLPTSRSAKFGAHINKSDSRNGKRLLLLADRILKRRLKLYFDTIMQRYDYPEGSVVTQRRGVQYGGTKNKSISVGIYFIYAIIVAAIMGELIVTNYRYLEAVQYFSMLEQSSRSMDTASWAVWSTLLVQSMSDFSRIVFDGVIPNTYFSQHGMDDLLSVVNKRKKAHSQTLLLYSRYVQVFVSRFNETSLIPAGLLARKKVEIELYDIAKYAENGTVDYYLEYVSPMEAFTILQPFIENLIYRNDTLPESTFSLGPVEQMLRYNLMNPLHEYAITTSQEVNAYMTGMSGHLVYFMKSSPSYSAIGGASLLLALMGILFSVRNRARNFIVKVTNFRRADVRTSLQSLSALREYYKLLTLDERDFFSNLDSHLAWRLTPISLSRSSTETGTTQSTRSIQKQRSITKKRKITKPDTGKVPLRNKSYYFGFLNYFVRAFIILAIWVGIKFCSSFPEVREAERLGNIVRLYSVTVDAWNTHCSMQVTIQSMATWGASAQVKNMPAQTILPKLLSRMSGMLIPALEDFRGADLGEFKDTYRSLTSNFSLWQFGKENTDFYQSTGEGATLFIDGDILSVLKNTVALIDSVRQQITLAGDDLVRIRKAFDNPNFKAYLFYAGIPTATAGYIGAFYYSIIPHLALEIKNLVQQRLNNNKNPTTLLLQVVLSMLVVMFLWLLVCTQLERFRSNLSNILLLVDIGLLRTNVLLTDLLKL